MSLVVFTISIPLSADEHPAVDNIDDDTLKSSLPLTESVENDDERYKRKGGVLAGHAFAEKQKKARRQWALARRNRKKQDESNETTNYYQRRFFRDTSKQDQSKRVIREIFESNSFEQAINRIPVQKFDAPQKWQNTLDGAHFENPIN